MSPSGSLENYCILPLKCFKFVNSVQYHVENLEYLERLENQSIELSLALPQKLGDGRAGLLLWGSLGDQDPGQGRHLGGGRKVLLQNGSYQTSSDSEILSLLDLLGRLFGRSLLAFILYSC